MMITWLKSRFIMNILPNNEAIMEKVDALKK